MARFADFTRALRGVVDQMTRSADAAAAETAASLASAIAAAAPVRKGNLRRSVRVEKSRRGGYVVKAGGPLTTREVGKGSGKPYDYALGTEFGTSTEAAEPFFYSTYRRVRTGEADKMVKAIGKPLDKDQS